MSKGHVHRHPDDAARIHRLVVAAQARACGCDLGRNVSSVHAMPLRINPIPESSSGSFSDTPPPPLQQDDTLSSSFDDDTNTSDTHQAVISTVYQAVYDFIGGTDEAAKDMLLVLFISLAMGAVARVIFNWYAERITREDMHKKDS